MLLTFYNHNVHMFVVSMSVCSWKACPALSNVCGVRPGAYPRASMLLHSGRL